MRARPRCEADRSLGPRIVEQIFEALAAINRQGTTLFLVERNAQMALDLAHSGYVLENGAIVLGGASKELRTDDRVRRAYLGET